jgi:hypothetical protein
MRKYSNPACKSSMRISSNLFRLYPRIQPANLLFWWRTSQINPKSKITLGFDGFLSVARAIIICRVLTVTARYTSLQSPTRPCQNNSLGITSADTSAPAATTTTSSTADSAVPHQITTTHPFHGSAVLPAAGPRFLEQPAAALRNSFMTIFIGIFVESVLVVGNSNSNKNNDNDNEIFEELHFIVADFFTGEFIVFFGIVIVVIVTEFSKVFVVGRESLVTI